MTPECHDLCHIDRLLGLAIADYPAVSPSRSVLGLKPWVERKSDDVSGGAMRIIFGLLLVVCWSTAASSQALQPGDTISISVYQDPKLDRQVLIGPSGMISFPLAGQIRPAV